MSDEQSVNDEHLGTICAFSIKFIMCVPWVTTNLPLSVPTNFKFKPIFLILNVEAQAHPKSSASQPIF
jgi:hypothetical protein